LAAAHAAQLIHRDFKPDNVLLGDDDRVRVVDFGLVTMNPVEPTPPGTFEAVKEFGALAPATASELVVGTPAYMAPEAFRGGPVDARADQFSFCVALFYGLYGVLPYSGASERARSSPNGSRGERHRARRYHITRSGASRASRAVSRRCW
jgi:serine/threonine protein kinase